jgi:putative iron-dependent peroxidase
MVHHARMTSSPQPAILAPVPPAARFITFDLKPDADAVALVRRLADAEHDPKTVVGIGPSLARGASLRMDGLRSFPADLMSFPSTQHALWLFLAHGDGGAMFDAGRAFMRRVAADLFAVEEIDAFLYRGGRDLSGFEDGTENPTGDDAVKAAIVAGRGDGADGGSFVAVQRWVHDLDAVERMTPEVRARAIGRDRETNAELDDAPASAHVRRTDQESFVPDGHIVRRSMPYGGVRDHDRGLYFVAYGESLDRFERQLRRMAGQEDGVLDGLLSFTRAVTGGYYFCPPLRAGRLDLRPPGQS